MSGNSNRSLLYFIVTALAGVIGLFLFATMWLRPQLGEESIEGWKQLTDDVVHMIEEDREGLNHVLHSPKSAPVPADQGTVESHASVPLKGDSASSTKEEKLSPSHASTLNRPAAIKEGEVASERTTSNQEGLVSLNTADEKQLDELPGVGPSKAKAIVAYREKHGNFQSIDEVMNVKGIGPKMFTKMKDKLTVD